MVLDLNGHFAISVSCVLEGVKTLVVIDTTSGSYITGQPIPYAAFDYAFSS